TYSHAVKPENFPVTGHFYDLPQCICANPRGIHLRRSDSYGLIRAEIPAPLSRTSGSFSPVPRLSCVGVFILIPLLSRIPINLPSEIAFIHDYDTELRKKELFAKVRSGQVRIVFGSTQKMGVGTNIQDKLVALHDLDCPWRPSDLEQRA
ncbi:MAG: hypothetical protein LBL79_02405, partial [Prevotella sp.]|nr:hypothetical protein [Prevotella sp.]